MNTQQTARKIEVEIRGAPTAYPRNCWWVGALAEEVTRIPLSRMLLETSVVFYRKEDGGVVALDDRCPHRWAPLSRGEVKGNDIACGYHGFQFGPDGKCTKIPSQGTVPPAVKVRSYPVVERGPFVWIWMGDVERSKAMVPPDLDFITGDRWARSRRWGAMPFKANYFSLMENVLDLTHFGFLHAKSLDIQDWVNAPEVAWDEDRVTYRQSFIGNPAPKIYGLPIAEGKPINRTDWGQLITPALQMGAADFEDPAPAPGARARFAFRVMHAATPATPHETHYWWLSAEDYLDPTPQQMAAIRAGVEMAFREDTNMLEAIERNVANDKRGRDYPETTVRADLAAIQARRLLAKWMAAE